VAGNNQPLTGCGFANRNWEGLKKTEAQAIGRVLPIYIEREGKLWGDQQFDCENEGKCEKGWGGGHKSPELTI